MNWVEFFKILADFIMKLVAFFKSSDNTEDPVTNSVE